jgi:hypothetical protein
VTAGGEEKASKRDVDNEKVEKMTKVQDINLTAIVPFNLAMTEVGC